ncbi:MAG: alpha-N-arabinofuranosidase [Armatimonadota bacterium]
MSLQRVAVVLNEPIGTISPYLHGEFAEHLGECIYPGIWVGEDSPIPNISGIRRDVVEALRPLGIPVLRWPGGCFADAYHWRDGIGARDKRPLRVNYHWGMAPEPNHFGTHEFIAFCRLIGAEPYLVGNIGSGTPAELRDWVEYCNFAGDSALANERRANGAQEPFGVRFWGVGNENWGCGGHMHPEHYAELFCRYRTFLFNYSGTAVHAIACGAAGNDWDWTWKFLNALRRKGWGRGHLVQSLAAHYYCGTAGTATEYTTEQWTELLCRAKAIEGIITGHRTVMDELDPEQRISLIIDEWGAWHPAESGKPSWGLYQQQNTIRDALVAALTLDIFHRHCHQIFMGNLAQLINVLQSLLLVQEDQCVKTPTYHVWQMYAPHKGAQAVRFETLADTLSDGGAVRDFCRQQYLQKEPFSLQVIEGSASVRENTLCVTFCNMHPEQPAEVEVLIMGAEVQQAEVTVLSSDDIHAHNTFDHPDRVKPSAPQPVRVEGDRLYVTAPPASVVRILSELPS